MRLAPVDRPASLLARVMSWGMQRQLGKVITPARVFYNRVPRLWNVAWAIFRAEGSLRIPHELALLVQTRVALLNGCTFCSDIATARAVQEKLGLEKFGALADWRASALFTERERAALAYAEEATLHKTVSDATFAALAKHFDEREIVEITFLNALENYYNLLNLPLEIPDDGLLAQVQRAHSA